MRFPSEFASHSKEQGFYFGEDFLLRRHDYRVDVAGGFPATHYVSDIIDMDGIKFLTKRRANVRGPKIKAIHDLLMISIDLSNFRFK